MSAGLKHRRFGATAVVWGSQHHKVAFWVIRYRFGARRESLFVRSAPKADAVLSIGICHEAQLPVDGLA